MFRIILLTCKQDEESVLREHPLKSETLAPFTATMGCVVPSKLSAWLPHIVRRTWQKQFNMQATLPSTQVLFNTCVYSFIKCLSLYSTLIAGWDSEYNTSLLVLSRSCISLFLSSRPVERWVTEDISIASLHTPITSVNTSTEGMIWWQDSYRYERKKSNLEVVKLVCTGTINIPERTLTAYQQCCLCQGSPVDQKRQNWTALWGWLWTHGMG